MNQEEISPAYTKFFAKFNEIDNLEVKDWNTTHILSYFCRKYKEYYNLDFTFGFKDPAPSKSREIYEVKKLAQQISVDPIILKNYIDWIFKEKIIARKKRITSLGYLTHTDLVNEYKFKFLFSDTKIERTTKLPQNIKAACSRYNVSINTYGELAFVKRMPQQDALFNELKNNGFDIGILDKLA